ncbi:MAG: YeiH family protein [Saccharospirillum sp.]|nr:YeiH family protein [Saccharospirillum sp.]
MLIVIPLLAAIAIALSQLPSMAALGLSALPLAILLGIVFGNLFRPQLTLRDARVMAFCQQRLLRLGIVLFGFNLSLQQIVAVGWQAIIIDIIIIVTVLSLGVWLGVRWFGLSKEAAVLTSVGSAICGAAAIMATESVVRGRERDVTVAVASVVLFGTLALFSYPLLYHWLDIDPAVFGIYIGSTVHEVAQAVAAGQTIGPEAMQTAVVTKLIRVMLLAPVVIFLGAVVFRQSDTGARRVVPVPWFVFGFILAAALNSWWLLPEMVLSTLKVVSQAALALAMASLGIKTQWATVRQAGIQPMLLALLLFVVLMVGGLGLNWVFLGMP